MNSFFLCHLYKKKDFNEYRLLKESLAHLFLLSVYFQVKTVNCHFKQSPVTYLFQFFVLFNPQLKPRIFFFVVSMWKKRETIIKLMVAAKDFV